MKRHSTLRPTPAILVAIAALVVAMSGAAIALPGKGKVTTNDIRKGAVKTRSIAKDAIKTKVIARGAVGSQEIKGKSIRGNRLKDKTVKWKQIADETITAKQIANGTITAKQIANGTIASEQVAPDGLNGSNIADYKAPATGLVPATDGADADAARAAAPAALLFAKGQLSIYAKCFRDAGANEVHAGVFVASSAGGAIFDGADELSGGPLASDFLNPSTPETDRALVDGTIASAGDADVAENEFMAMAPDGTKLVGQLSTAAKNGDLAGGNGLYGPGNVCLFGAEVAG